MAGLEAAAERLAQIHFAVEDGLKHVFLIRERAGQQRHPNSIMLLEVNENTVPCGVMPLFFGPAPASGVFFPSVIVEITPDEFERIRAHDLALPDGWEVGDELVKRQVDGQPSTVQ